MEANCVRQRHLRFPSMPRIFLVVWVSTSESSGKQQGLDERYSVNIIVKVVQQLLGQQSRVLVKHTLAFWKNALRASFLVA